MANSLLVPVTQALPGTLIRATFQTDFDKPPVITDPFVTEQMIIGPTTTAGNAQKVVVGAPTSLSAHQKGFLAAVKKEASTPNIRASLMTYTLHASQVLNPSSYAARFRIGLFELNNSVAAILLEFGFDALRGGIVDVYHYGELKGSYTHWDFLPSTTVLKIEIAPFEWKALVNDAIIYRQDHNPGTFFPLQLRYEYRHMSGDPNIPPGGDGYTFNEPVLSGAWVPIGRIDSNNNPSETFWRLTGYSAGNVALDLSGVYGTTTGVLITSKGFDAAGYPYMEWVHPPSGSYPPVGGGSPVALSYVKATMRWNPSYDNAFPKPPGGAQSANITVLASSPGTPLTVDGANPITLVPSYDGADFHGAPYRVTASYPASELTYTAVGGFGSFGTGADKNLYAAPSEAGVYTFKVTRGSEEVTVTVKVPAIIAPSAISMVGSTTQIFETNFDVVNYATTGWDVTGGSLASKAIRSVTYTAPSSAGSWEVRAQANVTGILVGQTAAVVTTSSAGAPPSTGLRLTPGGGISAAVNTVVGVTMEGDVSPVIWATITNFRIDGSNNNLFILNNRAAAETIIAQALLENNGTANLKWAFNSTNLATSLDSCFYSWMVLDDAEGVVARLTLEYLHTGNDWRIELYTFGELLASADFTATSSTEIQIDFTAAATAAFKYRPSSGDSWITLATPTNLYGSRYFKLRYQPDIRSQADNTVIVAKPTLSGLFGRWYPPTFNAELIDNLGNIIGSLPLQRTLALVIVGTFWNWIARVTLTASGTGRVRASYPSGIVPQNTVPLTISPAAGDPLVVTSPASSPITLDPGDTITVTTNASDPATVSYVAPVGNGSFGLTFANRNVYTAPAKSGLFYFEVVRGSERIRIDARVRAKIAPTAISIQANQTVQLSVNYDGVDQSVFASSGTASFGPKGNGTTVVNYTAPAVAGNYTITYSNPINNVSVAVTVTAVGTDPVTISNTDPTTLEPGATAQILTNYPASEITFTVRLYGTTVNLAGYFSSDVFRAPSQAGKYEITATKSGVGSDTMIVIVPIRLTPKTPAPVKLPNQIQFVANYSPVTWSVPPGRSGTINQSGVFTPGSTPDTVPVTVAGLIDGVPYSDSATVTVLAPTLYLQNPSAMTVQPAATVTVLPGTPYAVGDVTYSATGGSFAANVWTAPSGAGTYILTVTHATSGQTSTITVTVPVVLTPSTWAMQVNVTQVFTINRAVTSWNPSPGLTLTSIGSTSITVSASVAGTYTLEGLTDLGNVTATITVTGTAAVPLAITNPDPTIVEPGGQLTIVTNYPSAEVTFTTTGGTFVGSVFTAPLQAGGYTITATRGASSDSMVVNVPVRISPAAVVLQPGQTQQFTVNHPSFTWSVSGSGGGISATGEYTAGMTPGSYPNGVRVSTPAGVGYASVTIQQVDLVVYGPRSIILEPGASYRVESNPFGRSVSYTAFGGSFGSGSDANLYTAPAPAGDYHFTVTYADQTIRIDVHVPLRISPKSVNLSPSQTHQFTVNAAGASWTASSTSGASGFITANGLYTAPASGGTIVTITASGNGDSDTALVYFLDIYPYNPTYSVEGETQPRVVLVRTEDGNPKGRLRSDTPFKRQYALRYVSRSKAEYVAALEFHRARFPDKPFLFHDYNVGEHVAVYFDSGFKWDINGSCSFTYSWRLIEV